MQSEETIRAVVAKIPEGSPYGDALHWVLGASLPQGTPLYKAGVAVEREGKHVDFLMKAVALSLENARQSYGGPFGAVVVKGGHVVGSGQNSVTRSKDPTAHAEVLAIRDAATRLETHDLSGCVLYTSCEPCPMCLGAVLWARLDAVYFAATRDDAALAGFDDSAFYAGVCSYAKGPHSLPIGPIPGGPGLSARAAAQEAFRAWSADASKKAY